MNNDTDTFDVQDGDRVHHRADGWATVTYQSMDAATLTLDGDRGRVVVLWVDWPKLITRWAGQDRRYRIVRFYRNRPGHSRTITDGLTLAQAQRHCNDPETSSSTCTNAAGRARTRRMGAWFDGYTDERNR